MTLLRILGYLWSAPHTLVGLLLCAVWYRSGQWRWSDGAIECISGRYGDGSTRIIGKPGAQTHGCLIVYSSVLGRATATLRTHERVHVKQGMVGGPLYVIAYVLSFLWLYLRRPRAGWREAYLAIPFERHARRVTARALGGRGE